MCRFKPRLNRLCFFFFFSVCLFAIKQALSEGSHRNRSCYTDMQNMVRSFSPTQVDGSVYQSLDTTLCIFQDNVAADASWKHNMDSLCAGILKLLCLRHIWSVTEASQTVNCLKECAFNCAFVTLTTRLRRKKKKKTTAFVLVMSCTIELFDMLLLRKCICKLNSTSSIFVMQK